MKLTEKSRKLNLSEFFILFNADLNWKWFTIRPPKIIHLKSMVKVWTNIQM